MIFIQVKMLRDKYYSWNAHEIELLREGNVYTVAAGDVREWIRRGWAEEVVTPITVLRMLRGVEA